MSTEYNQPTGQAGYTPLQPTAEGPNVPRGLKVDGPGHTPIPQHAGRSPNAPFDSTTASENPYAAYGTANQNPGAGFKEHHSSPLTGKPVTGTGVGSDTYGTGTGTGIGANEYGTGTGGGFDGNKYGTGTDGDATKHGVGTDLQSHQYDTGTGVDTRKPVAGTDVEAHKWGTGTGFDSNKPTDTDFASHKYSTGTGAESHGPIVGTGVDTHKHGAGLGSGTYGSGTDAGSDTYGSGTGVGTHTHGATGTGSANTHGTTGTGVGAGTYGTGTHGTSGTTLLDIQAPDPKTIVVSGPNGIGYTMTTGYENKREVVTIRRGTDTIATTDDDDDEDIGPDYGNAPPRAGAGVGIHDSSAGVGAGPQAVVAQVEPHQLRATKFSLRGSPQIKLKNWLGGHGTNIRTFAEGDSKYQWRKSFKGLHHQLELFNTAQPDTRIAWAEKVATTEATHKEHEPGLPPLPANQGTAKLTLTEAAMPIIDIVVTSFLLVDRENRNDPLH